MSGRTTIFQAIHAALEPIKEPAAYPEYDSACAEAQWLANEHDLVDLFSRRLRQTGAVLLDSLDACVAWLEQEKPALLYLAPEFIHLRSALEVVCPVTDTFDRAQIDEIDCAITPAWGAIAESGTLILAESNTVDRLAALAPWRHIAALSRDKIFRSINDAVTALPPDQDAIWVTGPSKTADVEGILIQGVHGPGQQACLLI